MGTGQRGEVKEPDRAIRRIHKREGEGDGDELEGAWSQIEREVKWARKRSAGGRRQREGPVGARGRSGA